MKILMIGIEQPSDDLIVSCGDHEVTRITNSDDFANSFESWADGLFLGIFCGPAIADLSPLELAQTLNNQCPKTSKVFVTTKSEGFAVKNLIKNGFESAFKLPLDSDILKARVVEAVAESLGEKVFKQIKVLDLGSEDPLSFETFVFLPLNKKKVPFSRAGDRFDNKKLERLQKHHVHSVMIDKKDMPRFYDQTAKNLKKLANGKVAGISETERKEKLTGAVRELILDLFDQSSAADLTEGRELKEKTEKIIESYISNGSSDLYNRLTSTLNSSADGYEHVSSVATLAALLAMGIGHPRPEDLAMAGLFHEMGLSNLPTELAKKSEADMTPDERRLYQSHPEASVRMVKEKRMLLTKEVEQAILQHHERFDGKGFPKALSSLRISEDAQILSFADQFDELTRTEGGRKRLSPLEAIGVILKSESVNPTLIDRIRVLFNKAA